MSGHAQPVSQKKIAARYEGAKDTYNRNKFFGPADNLVEAAGKPEEKSFGKYLEALVLLENGARKAEKEKKGPLEFTLYATKAQAYREQMEKKKRILGELRPDTQKQFENAKKKLEEFITRYEHRATELNK